jgi:hypothetical protein
LFDQGTVFRHPASPLQRGTLQRGPLQRGPLQRGPLQRGPLQRGTNELERAAASTSRLVWR